MQYFMYKLMTELVLLLSSYFIRKDTELSVNATVYFHTNKSVFCETRCLLPAGLAFLIMTKVKKTLTLNLVCIQ